MGLIETVEEHATNCNYRINDGTGIIECKYWSDKESTERSQRYRLHFIFLFLFIFSFYSFYLFVVNLPL